MDSVRSVCPEQGRGISASYEEAFREIMSHRTMLEVYLQALIRDPDLAEETFSEVVLEIARGWDRYDKTRPFGPWARVVARRLAWDKLRRRGAGCLPLDPDVLESVAARIDALGDEAQLELRLKALRRCTEKLPPACRQLVRLRYFESRPYEEIARRVSRTVNALYVAYNRIHEALLECVRKHLEWA